MSLWLLQIQAQQALAQIDYTSLRDCGRQNCMDILLQERARHGLRVIKRPESIPAALLIYFAGEALGKVVLEGTAIPAAFIQMWTNLSNFLGSPLGLLLLAFLGPWTLLLGINKVMAADRADAAAALTETQRIAAEMAQREADIKNIVERCEAAARRSESIIGGTAESTRASLSATNAASNQTRSIVEENAMVLSGEMRILSGKIPDLAGEIKELKSGNHKRSRLSPTRTTEI
ncbi:MULTISPECIES: hypothetical protein [unclassified Novosphingobium]|uniref:hypothetical protein n=1 Tax=unclassified Novosphingobium TaxID=2644732 RepID=UPI0025FBA4A7|nr:MULTISPECIES: hypothetical protein [unclassified Novosphingobium]HQV04478.1 hypothetical protein [Novosphingobium sp.]